jgi:hypothetical protein
MSFDLKIDLFFQIFRNETLLRDYPNHQFIAGGATQNTMRASTVNIFFSIK